jgi:hypothetical protein
MRCARAVAVFFAAWLGAAGVVFAQQRELRPTSLAWVRGAGAQSCAGPAAVATAIEARLRRPVFVSASRAELSLEALIEPLQRAGGGWRVTISIARAEGAAFGGRTVESSDASCQTATDAAVLTIAQLLDPSESASASAASTSPDGSPSALPAPAPAPSRTDRVTVDWMGGLGFGLLPHVAPGVSLHARVRPRSAPLQLQVSGKYLFEQAVDVRKVPPGEGRFSLLAAGLALCTPPAQRRTLATSFCAGAEGGAIALRDEGLAPASHRTAIVNATVRGNVAFALSDHWRVATGAEVLVPLRRPEFSGFGASAERVLIYRVAPVAAAFEMGVGFAF